MNDYCPAPMALYLIRCAKAGRRERWDGPDRLRPLVAAGRVQADALAEWLGVVPVPHILSSPFTRCVETVTPLAERHHLEVEQFDSLAPGKDFQSALEWIRVLPDHAVLCTHGVVITGVMEILTRQGAELDGPADWRKGATWVLARDERKVVRVYTRPPRRQLDIVTR